MSNFVVQFPLKTEKYQEDILHKRFNMCREIYNALVTVTYNRYKEMIKTREYRNLIASLTGNKKNDKEIWKKINDIRKQHGFTEFSFFNDVTSIYRHFNKEIDSKTAQGLAKNLWVAYDRMFYGNGKKVRYKRYGELNSVSSKTNASGIRFRDNMVIWKKLKIPVIINYRNYYECQALQSKVVYCTLVRKFVKNRYRFYVAVTRSRKFLFLTRAYYTEKRNEKDSEFLMDLK